MTQHYEEPVRALIRDMIQEIFDPGVLVSRGQIYTWFERRYALIKPSTISCHLNRLSTNSPSRKHHHSGLGNSENDDLLFKVDRQHFRLYSRELDPKPERL